MKNGLSAGYLLGIGTDGSDNTVTNSCGITKSHAFSVPYIFEITATGGSAEKVMMIRNPWGTTAYSSDWHKNDARWDAAAKA